MRENAHYPLRSLPPEVNFARLKWDIARARNEKYDEFWEKRSVIPTEIFTGHPKVWLEIGAGSGWFCTEMAKRHPEAFLVAIERCKSRGQRLVRKTKRSGLANLAGFRGNAIPTLIHGVPNEAVERVYILYPCPWPKNSHRKHRWYLHPIMPHLLRILKPGGVIVWASDQKFYIDEATFVCTEVYGLTKLAGGKLSPNPYNALDHFPGGRTKFERTFLGQGLPCHELVVRKS